MSLSHPKLRLRTARSRATSWEIFLAAQLSWIILKVLLTRLTRHTSSTEQLPTTVSEIGKQLPNKRKRRSGSLSRKLSQTICRKFLRTLTESSFKHPPGHYQQKAVRHSLPQSQRQNTPDRLLPGLPEQWCQVPSRTAPEEGSTMPVLNERLVGHPWQGTQRTRTDIPACKGLCPKGMFLPATTWSRCHDSHPPDPPVQQEEGSAAESAVKP